MHTLESFTSEWRKRHHDVMPLEHDMPFYHGIYMCLQDIVGGSAGHADEDCIFHILMYIENSVSVGTDAYYGRMYRSLGDPVAHWCRRMELDAESVSLVEELVSQAVADAPSSSLLQRIEESVLSGDFLRLKDVALFFTRQDATLSGVYPNLKFRKEAYLKLTDGDENTASDMLRADMAFNWRDKKGQTLLGKLSEVFKTIIRNTDVSECLDTVRPERLEAYWVSVSEDNGLLTLANKDGRIFKDVVFSIPFSEDGRKQCFIGQLVTYHGTTYQNGPGLWSDKETYDRWDGNALWSAVEEDEKEDARNSFFTTSFGKKVSLYDDLYVYHDGTEGGYPDELGIYPDEPCLLDFLEWLKPIEKNC